MTKRDILKELDFWRATWAARDKDGEIWGFTEKPRKRILKGIWTGRACCHLSLFRSDYLKWTDKKPVNVKEELNKQED